MPELFRLPHFSHDRSPLSVHLLKYQGVHIQSFFFLYGLDSIFSFSFGDLYSSYVLHDEAYHDAVHCCWDSNTTRFQENNKEYSKCFSDLFQTHDFYKYQAEETKEEVKNVGISATSHKWNQMY